MRHEYILTHSGTKRHSGRFEWGSGEIPYQHEPWFQGWGKLSPKEQSAYAKEHGMSLKEARYKYSIAKSAMKAAQIGHAKELRYTRQMSPKAIAEKMGVSETTVNSWLKSDAEEKTRQARDIADKLGEYAKKHAAVDIGKGCCTAMGVKKTKFEVAVQILKDEGYYNLKWKQLQQTTGKKTEMTALVAPKPEWKNMTEKEIKADAYKQVMSNLDDVSLPFEVKCDDVTGKMVSGFDIPKSISSKKIQVVYTDKEKGTGGIERDGMIEVRRGASGLDLGGNYAQVRIAVDGTHYLKGMAVYADDLPDGIDIRVNSKKKPGTPLKGYDDNTVFKPMKTDDKGEVDLEDPFGAQITAQKGYINKVNEEGDWMNWTSASSLASQVLSKQRPEVAKKQLDLDYASRKEEYESIKQITNPVIRKKRLEDFGDECDKAAVHLKAAALPGQSVKVLLSLPSLKPGECYCPQYNDGDKLALIRYPHGSKAEIPILTVNNSNKEGKRVITPNSDDAIGVHPKDAQRLSGADFDGDTVVVIPNNKGVIQSRPAYKDLERFDTGDWPGYDGMPKILHSTQQKEMGVVTNLITDMTLIGAKEDEMVRAIKYSMVIIDSEKHNLNWKGAKEEYRIAELHKKYQGKATGGASTIISRASGEQRVPEREEYTKIDPKTGKLIYKETERKWTTVVDPKTGKSYHVRKSPWEEGYDPEGKPVLIKSTKMTEAKNAYELVSPSKYPMERVYADYANQMKALANEARKESLKVKDNPYSPAAAKAYAEEVASLKDKIEKSKINAALERLAQRSADVIIRERVEKYPERYNDRTPDGKKHLSKLRNQVTARQRAALDKKKPFDVTEREWDAIQAGALRKTDVVEIVNRANAEQLKKYSTPKNSKLSVLSPSSLARAKAMLNSGFTRAEVASSFDISPSTLSKMLKEEKGGK